jgi:uncharacterized protein YbcV (DUF1398 family)
MFDSKVIENIAATSKVEKWPYPKIFNSLKDAGVEYYETKVANHEITYFGGGKSFQEPISSKVATLTVSDQFNESAVQEAVRTNQSKGSTYMEFLEQIAGAGVDSYRVDMSERTVTYMGASGEKYIEKVPNFD